MNEHLVGRSITRIDSDAKVRGSAQYTVDVRLPGMLAGGFLRAGIPHARILDIDTSAARALPGVRAVVTGQDWPVNHGPLVHDQPPLAIDRVRHSGEVVAAVAAENEDVLAEALDLISVDLEPLPAVTTLDEALAPGAPLVHDRYLEYPRVDVTGLRLDGIPGTNIPYHFKLRKGDVDYGFEEADVVVEGEYSTQFVQHCHLEPHVAIAQFDPSGSLTVWASTMGPHTLRSMLADFIRLPLSKVRVITPFVGGAFGAKMYLRTVNPVAVLLAREAGGRPVRVAFDREDEFFTSPGRLPSRISIKTGATREGIITARMATMHWEQGAYVDLMPRKVRNAGYVSLGPYRIPHASVDGYLVYTNRQPSGAFRGFGVPQVTWAGERQMDELAAELDLDPIELRLRNILQDDDQSVTGETMRDVGARAVLLSARKAMDKWPSRTSSPGRQVGRGLALTMKSTITPTATFGTVRLNSDGSVEVYAAAVEHGQGSRTVLVQIVAEELTLPIEQIEMAQTDTSVAPYDRSSTSSRTTFHMGNTLRAAAIDLRNQLLNIASDLIGVPTEELVVRKGIISMRDGEGPGYSFPSLLARHFKGPASLIGNGAYSTHDLYGPMDQDTGASSRPTAFWGYAASVAEVEFDEETGHTELVHLATAVDAGRAINPLGCRQQIVGASVMGIGLALMEEVHFEDGTPANPTFLDYKVPTTLDVPDVEPIIVETAEPEGPYGARGVAEIGLAVVPAAIGNAVHNASGVSPSRLPMRAEDLYRQVVRGGGA